MANRMDAMASYIMAQSALLKPSGLPLPSDGYPQDQEVASILRHVVAEQDGNTNPTHHAILLRADLENRHFFVDIRQESKTTTRDIDDVMHLSKDFLQTITNLDWAFALTVQPCLELARRMRQIAEKSAVRDYDEDAKIKRTNQNGYTTYKGSGRTCFKWLVNSTNQSPSDACLK